MSAAALAVAYLLDLVAGDPKRLPHPVRLMGTVITAGEDFLRSRDTNRRRDLVGGALLAVGVTAGAAGAVGAALWLLGLVHPGLAITTGIITGWTTLATRSLSDEASAVLDALDHQDLPKARRQLGRIVGRDTEALDESDVSRAVIETVAESTCDGIVSPLFYLAIGAVCREKACRRT